MREPQFTKISNQICLSPFLPLLLERQSIDQPEVNHEEGPQQRSQVIGEEQEQEEHFSQFQEQSLSGKLFLATQNAPPEEQSILSVKKEQERQKLRKEDLNKQFKKKRTVVLVSPSLSKIKESSSHEGSITSNDSQEEEHLESIKELKTKKNSKKTRKSQPRQRK